MKCYHPASAALFGRIISTDGFNLFDQIRTIDSLFTATDSTHTLTHVLFTDINIYLGEHYWRTRHIRHLIDDHDDNISDPFLVRVVTRALGADRTDLY